MREQITILEVLSEDIHNAEIQTLLRNALKQVRALSEKRNKVVHAIWGVYGDERARFWIGLTEKHIQEIAYSDENTKRRKNNVFTLTDLDLLTKRATGLTDQLIAINKKLNSRWRTGSKHSSVNKS